MREPRRFGLKPDIILEGDEKIILDTKWKFKIIEDDMYQMFAYVKRYDAKKIFILCPAEENIYRSEDFCVKVFCVDLFNMENLRGLIEGRIHVRQ